MSLINDFREDPGRRREDGLSAHSRCRKYPSAPLPEGLTRGPAAKTLGMALVPSRFLAGTVFPERSARNDYFGGLVFMARAGVHWARSDRPIVLQKCYKCYV